MPTPLYSSEYKNKARLRVGLLLDSWTVPKWVAEVVKSIQQSGVADIAAVVINAAAPAGPNQYARRQIAAEQSGPSTFLWKLYLQLDTAWHKHFNDPFKPTDIDHIAQGASVVSVEPVRNGSEDRFPDAACAAIREQQLDVLVRLGFNELRGDILTAAKHGVWSYHHRDTDVYDGGPSGFWEMYERNPLSGVTLQILTGDHGGAGVIYRSYGATRSYESLLMNRHCMYRKAVPFVARCLRQLHSTGMLAAEPPKPSSKRPLYGTPSKLTCAIFMARVIPKMIRTRIEDRLDIVRDHWFIAYKSGVHRRLAPNNCMGIITLSPPKGTYWADPMVVKKEATNYVFLEEFDYRSRRGRIVVVGMDTAGVRREAQVAMEADHHLSYPFVFEWNGDHYMVPETSSVRAVKLFRAVEFPTRWTFVKELLSDVCAADPTLLEHENHWYLFASVSESGGSINDELFLFHADSPLGPWAPHPMNPIVSDVRRARPAGALFREGKILFRPAQNGAPSYGSAMSVAEVTKLTPTDYAERVDYEIKPDWFPGIHGTHTISFSEDLTVLDGKTVKWRP